MTMALFKFIDIYLIAITREKKLGINVHKEKT